MRNWILACALPVVVALLGGTPALRAQTNAPAAQMDPASLPAHDSHQNVLAAADPYIALDRYKDKFGKHTPSEAGIAAIDLYLRNDGAAPLKVDIDSIRLRIGAPGEAKQTLNTVSPEYVANRVLLKGTDPKARRLPLPLPGEVPASGRGKTWDEFDGELRSMALSADVIPPHATVHGFVYFDVNHQYAWLADSKLELPDITSMLDHKPLLFFEIDFAAAKP